MKINLPNNILDKKDNFFDAGTQEPVYLDSASTTSVDPRVMEAMLPYFSEIFGNASSNHVYGKKAQKAIRKARYQVAEIINAEPSEIIFTSGATEAVNLAIKGYVEANSDKGNHIITVKTEHKAVLSTCEYLETKGVEVTYLDVDENGLISLAALEAAIKETTMLIVVMYVNNEIGIIQPIQEIGEITSKHNIAFFSDATQAVGKVPVDVLEDQIDMLCFSGHKLNGPKGVGALYVRNGIELTPLIHGGGQENGLRGGTYNTPLIVGLGETCEISSYFFDNNIENLNTKRKEIERFFTTNRIGVVNFEKVRRAPHIISITLLNDEAEDYLLKNSKKIAASTGSACNSQLISMSHVLQEIFDQGEEGSTIRISI